MKALKMIKSGEGLQIAGDGRKLARVMPGNGIFLINNPVVRQAKITYGSQEVYRDCGGYFDYIPEDPEIEINIISRSFEYMDGDCDLLEFEYFKSKTVNELFAIIQQKLQERKG